MALQNATQNSWVRNTLKLPLFGPSYSSLRRPLGLTCSSGRPVPHRLPLSLPCNPLFIPSSSPSPRKKRGNAQRGSARATSKRPPHFPPSLPSGGRKHNPHSGGPPASSLLISVKGCMRSNHEMNPISLNITLHIWKLHNSIHGMPNFPHRGKKEPNARWSFLRFYLRLYDSNSALTSVKCPSAADRNGQSNDGEIFDWLFQSFRSFTAR